MNRATLWYLLAMMLSCSLCVVGHLEWQDARNAAADAESNLAAMQSLASVIQSLRQQETTAVLNGGSTAGQSIQPWLEQAQRIGIRQQQLTNFESYPQREIEGSSYCYEDVFIRLSNVSVESLIQFMLATSEISEGLGFEPSSVHLRPSGASRSGVVDRSQPELWMADLILTRLVFKATNQSTQ